MTAQQVAAHIERQLRARGDAQRAEHEQRYLKSQLEHVGASVPLIRKITRTALAGREIVTHDEVVGLVTALWAPGSPAARRRRRRALRALRGRDAR